MPYLTKTKRYTIIPGTPGTAAIPGTTAAQGTPGRTYVSNTLVKVCAGNKLYGGIAPNRTTATGHASLVLSNGYNVPVMSVMPVMSPTSKIITCSWVWRHSTTYQPAVSGTPGSTGIPGTPGTPARIIEHLSEGWNSGSRSVSQFVLGKYITYYVPVGVRGMLLSIGVNGKVRSKINTFSHSILVEPGGIMVFEGGANIDTIKYSCDSSSKIRLYRQEDNSVICVVTTGAETLVHLFSAPAYATPSTPLYAYANMYIADDAVHEASFETGQVQFGQA